MYTNGFLTIDEIVSDLQYRGQDYSLTNYDYWFHLVIKGLQKINVYNLRTSNVAYLPLTTTNIIQLSSDYIDYIQIGVVNGSGVFKPLTYDPNIFPVPQADCGEDTSTVLHADKVSEAPIAGLPGPYILYGETLPVVYGATGGYNAGYYNVNRQDNQLYISGLPVGTAIAVEYKTSGVSLTGLTMIRQQCQEALISWCMMTAQQFGVIQSQTNWANKYYGDEAELESLDQALTSQELQDILYGTWKQSPKR
jgi:hypothetical protein